MASLPGLPAELLNNIVQSCAHIDIKHLSETCRLLHNKMLPELFRTLDLSTHNATVECRYDGYVSYKVWNRATEEASVPTKFLAREWHRIDKVTARKQGLLVRTIAERPSYGKYVRELRWTVLDSHQNMACRRELLGARPRQWPEFFARMNEYWGGIWGLDQSDKLDLIWNTFREYDGKENFGDTYEDCLGQERESFPPEDESLWRTFHSFVHVIGVDLCWLRPWREATLPTPLFPTAKSVRLSGRMTHMFVACILEGTSSPGPRLESLEMNDLKMWAELESACNHPRKSPESGIASLAPDTEEPELTPPASNHLQELSRYLDRNRTRLQTRSSERVVAETIDTLANRFFPLTSLRITIAGPDTDYRPTTQDSLLYSSWSRFLESMRTTLHYLFFEQCEGRKTSCAPVVRRGRHQTTDIRLMDWLFVQQILPVLLDAPWPQMKRVEIRGVGRIEHISAIGFVPSHEVRHVAFTPKAREQFRGNLNYDVELIIEEEPSQTCEHVDSADLGIPPAYSQWEAWKATVEQREHEDHDAECDAAFAIHGITSREQRLSCWKDGDQREKEFTMRLRSANCVPYVKYVGPNLESQSA